MASSDAPWESAPLVQTDPWESAPMVKPALPAKIPTEMQALGRGFVQGGTLGFGDEIGGGVQGLLQGAANVAPKGWLDWAGIENRYGDTPVSETYKTARNDERAANKAAEAAHGNYYTAGNLAGGLVTTPLMPTGEGATLLRLMGASGALGAAQGLGNSESDSVLGDVGNTLAGGALGAGAGALGYGAGKVFGGASQYASGRSAAIQEQVAAKAAAEAAGETAAARGAAGRAAQNAYKQLEHLRELGRLGQLSPEQATVAQDLAGELAEKAQAQLVPAATEKEAASAAFKEMAGNETERAAQMAADKLSAGEFKRQVGARALRYGLPALGGMAGWAMGGTHGALSGLGLGSLAGAGMRPAMRSMLTLAKQPVVRNALWGLVERGGQVGSALIPEAESLMLSGTHGLESEGLSLMQALADARKKKEEQDAIARAGGFDL